MAGAQWWHWAAGKGVGGGEASEVWFYIKPKVKNLHDHRKKKGNTKYFYSLICVFFIY